MKNVFYSIPYTIEFAKEPTIIEEPELCFWKHFNSITKRIVYAGSTYEAGCIAREMETSGLGRVYRVYSPDPNLLIK